MRRLLATAILTLAAAFMAPAVTRAQDSSVPDGSVPTSAPSDDTATSGTATSGTGTSGTGTSGTGTSGTETPGTETSGSVPATTTPGTVPLVPVPSACTAPPQPEIVFVGTLVERDFRTGRFEIEQVRAGSEDPFAISGLIDVRYGLDVEYLEVGTEYLVSARRDPVIGLLASKIREPAPLFGGDDVVGVAESDVECPRFEDPVRTFLPDGSSIDSAVLAPLRGHTTQLVGAVLIPIGVAFGIVFVLATLRWSVGGLLRGVGSVVRHSR